jgi:hypothetical protein
MATPYFIQNALGTNGGATNSVIATFNYPNATGGFIVVQVNYSSGALPTMSDSAGNTYHHAVDDGVGLAYFYAYDLKPFASVNQITAQFVSTNFYSMSVNEYGGVQSSADPLDRTDTASGTGTAATTGAIVPTQNHELVLGSFETNSGSDLAPSNGFTQRYNNNFGQQIFTEFIQGTAASITSDAVLNTGNWSGIIASFKSAPGSAGACAQIGFVTQAGTTLVGTTPEGAQSGDVLYFMLGCYDQTSIVFTPPTGATLVPGTRVDHPSGGDDALTTAIYQLVLTGPPAPTYTFTSTGGVGNSVDVLTLCVRFTRPTGPVDTGAGAPTTGNGFSSAPAAPSLTTSTAVELVGWYWYGDDQPLTAAPIGSGTLGFTAQIDGTGAPNNLGGGYYGFYLKPQSTPSATGSVATTTAATDDWITTMFAIVPQALGTVDAMFYGAP